MILLSSTRTILRRKVAVVGFVGFDCFISVRGLGIIAGVRHADVTYRNYEMRSFVCKNTGFRVMMRKDHGHTRQA